MPRYFFDLEDHQREPDDEGTLLDGPEAGRTEAVCSPAPICATIPIGSMTAAGLVVSVRDDAKQSIVGVVVSLENGS